MYLSICSYPMFPLPVDNPLTETSMFTKDNMSYGKYTWHIAAEDENNYACISSAVSPTVPLSSFGK